MSEPERYYYYANARGCLKSPKSVDEVGVGINDGPDSCAIRIRLIELEGRVTMEAAAHNDEWKVFTKCRDVLDLLSSQMIPSGEMCDRKPFYALREHLERLGYENLGVLT